MEGKTVILSVLIMSMVMVQIQVEAKVCCPDQDARSAYNICCMGIFATKYYCAEFSKCNIVDGPCPGGYNNDILENIGDHDVSEYCKLGCVSSVCGALTTLQSSDASEIVNGAVDQCTKACSTFCTKGSKTATEIA